MDIPPEFKAVIPPAIGVGIGTLIRLSRCDQRITWRRIVFVEAPTMAGLAVIAAALAEHWGMTSITAAGVGVALGQVGSRAIDMLITWRTGVNPSSAETKQP